MRPAIKEGSIIIINKTDDYEIEDIITFNATGNRIITHRITDIPSENTYITKGDFNSANDVDLVTKENIIGEYQFKIPLVGHIISFAQSKVGFMILIFIPAIIIIYEEIKNIRNEVYKIKQKNL